MLKIIKLKKTIAKTEHKMNQQRDSLNLDCTAIYYYIERTPEFYFALPAISFVIGFSMPAFHFSKRLIKKAQRFLLKSISIGLGL